MIDRRPERTALRVAQSPMTEAMQITEYGPSNDRLTSSTSLLRLRDDPQNPLAQHRRRGPPDPCRLVHAQLRIAH